MITDPDLQVVSGGMWEGLTEPWRVVELAAGAGGTTPLAVPERVIGEENIWNTTTMIARVTEVIISNKCSRMWPVTAVTAFT